MKAIQNQLPAHTVNEKLALILLLSILLVVSFFQDSKGQGLDRLRNDPYFPARHKFSAGFITTYRGSSIPAPVMIGEVTYGISNRFSLSVVGGTTGTLSLVGMRLATRLYQHKNFRLLYRMTMIYYPERKGTFLFDKTSKNVMPWMLSMGLLDAEWRIKNGVRLSVGTGLLETHCIDGMMDLVLGRKPGAEEEEDEQPFELFNTMQTSVSIPLSKKLTLRPEAIVIFQGTQLVTGDQHKVNPLNIYLNLVYTF